MKPERATSQETSEISGNNDLSAVRDADLPAVRAVDAKAAVAVQAGPNTQTDADTPSNRMAAYYRNRLFGRPDKDYSRLGPGFLLDKMPSDCPIVVALHQLLWFISEQKKLFKDEKAKLDLVENIHREKFPGIDLLLKEYEKRCEETAATFLFKSGPRKLEIEALNRLNEAIRGFLTEAGTGIADQEPAESLRLWRLMVPSMIDAMRHHLTLLEQDITLYSIRFMKLKHEFTTLLGQLPEGELESIITANSRFKEMYDAVMAAEVKV